MKELFSLRVVVYFAVLLVFQFLYENGIFVEAAKGGLFQKLLTFGVIITVIAELILLAIRLTKEEKHKKRIKKEKTCWAFRTAVYYATLVVVYVSTMLYLGYDVSRYSNVEFCQNIATTIVAAELIIFVLKGTGIYSKIVAKL